VNEIGRRGNGTSHTRFGSEVHDVDIDPRRKDF
jgi:hypothetical protein